MKQKMTFKPKGGKLTQSIDFTILERINAKIAKAHKEIESPYIFKKTKRSGVIDMTSKTPPDVTG
jgi:hypothetical protein